MCCGKDNQTGAFGLYGLKNNTPVLIRPVSGRGSVWVSFLDGRGRWIGFEGSILHSGDLPGFVPIPKGAARPPIAIPVGGAIDALYTGVYQPTDFDTTAEIANRVQKQLDAIQELTELLKAAGVLV
jgi:hypothetical protein